MKSLRSQLLVIGCILVCLSAHAWATACAPFGQTQTGTIGSAGQTNACTFTANANDVVDFTMVTTSGSLNPEIQLFNSMGKLIASASNRYPNGACVAYPVVELNTVTLQASDTYTVIVGDCSSTNTGTYNFYSQRTNNPSGHVPLPWGGQPQTGSIASASQDNTYTFSANANDVVDFTMVTTSGNLIPRIRLYNSAGKLLNDQANRYPNGACVAYPVVELNTVTLPASGTYTVLVGDCSDTNTGAYDIYMQRTNNPSGAAPLPLGQTQTGNTASAAQSNTYTFNANANDVVDFTMVTTSGNLIPRIRLYNSAGKLLNDQANRYPNGACVAYPVVELNTVTLPASGTYTVLVGDCSDTNTGSYDIYMQRTDKPAGSGDLPFGQTQVGTISSEAFDNTYAFSANANDVVDFTMVTTSGNLIPRIRLYNSAGKLLNDQANRYPNGACVAYPVVELNTVKLPASDIYTVLVGDCPDTNTGNYDIYMQRTNNPSGATMLLFGQTQTGNTASAAQSNSYTFYANANDVVDFTMVTTSGNLIPRIRLYNPDGTLNGDAANRYPNGACVAYPVVELNTVKLPASGPYTVLVGDCSDTNTGNYTIYAQRTNKPFEPAPLVFGGQTQSGNIGLVAQVNSYTFSGSAGNTVDLTMVTTSGTLNPRIRLYNPDGTLIADDAARYPNGACVATAVVTLNSVTLTQNGDYTVLVGDCSDTKAGNYNLSGLCFGTCTPVVPPTSWPTPAAINFGTPLSATQLNATSSVPGSFVYSPPAGTVLPVGPNNLSVIFTPNDTATYTTAMRSAQIMVNNTAKANVAPTLMSFGNQAVNMTSAAKSVTLTNTGPVSLTINSIEVNGYFAISANTCGATLAVGKNCAVSVTFTPLALGAATGLLLITDNAPNSSQIVMLKGAGALPATLTPASGTYAPQTVGTTSVAKTFTLTNNQTVTLSSIVVSTTGDFAVSAKTCTTSLAAKATCTISVVFKPTATGTRTGKLSVSDSARNSPQTSSLTGAGVLPATLTPTSATYAAQAVGTTSAAQTFTLTNNQTVTLSSIVVSTTGDFAVLAKTCTTSLAAKATCTISVVFKPTATGTRTGKLSVSDSASNSPQTSSLTGAGK